jgi:hypothetical protein
MTFVPGPVRLAFAMSVTGFIDRRAARSARREGPDRAEPDAELGQQEERRAGHEERGKDQREAKHARGGHVFQHAGDEDADDRDREADGREQNRERDREHPELGFVVDGRRELLEDLDGGGQTEGHRRDHGRDVALVDVRTHAGDVADVVTDVVRDDARVARVVFRDVRLDLADDVGADVGGLRVDAAADAREERDAAGADRERVERRGQVRVFTELPVDGADADEAEASHAEAHDRAAVESDEESGRFAVRASRFGRAHVGVGGCLHAEEAGNDRQERATEERAPRERAELPREQAEDGCRVDRQHLVLAAEERHGAVADESRDALHDFAALGEGLDAEVETERDGKGGNADADSVLRKLSEVHGPGRSSGPEVEWSRTPAER